MGSSRSTASSRACEFHEAEFQEALFQEAEFQEALFQEAEFQEALFQEALFQEAEFQEALFQEALFQEAEFHEAFALAALFHEAASKTETDELPDPFLTNLPRPAFGFGGLSSSVGLVDRRPRRRRPRSRPPCRSGVRREHQRAFDLVRSEPRDDGRGSPRPRAETTGAANDVPESCM